MLIQATDAVVMGKRTFAMGEDPDWYVGNYEPQVPIFVLTHTPPPVMPKQDEHLTLAFVTDGVASAMAKAEAATGPRVVKVLGASVVQQVLEARPTRGSVPFPAAAPPGRGHPRIIGRPDPGTARSGALQAERRAV